MTSSSEKFEYKKILLLRLIHHFKSDLINNMDHMRISGNEPSPVILSQTKWFQTLKISDYTKYSEVWRSAWRGLILFAFDVKSNLFNVSDHITL